MSKYINKLTKKNIKRNIDIGIHFSISDGILEGIKLLVDKNIGVGQIFAGSNRSSSLKYKHKMTENQIIETKNYITTNKFKLFIHATYVLNLCKYPSTSSKTKYMLDNLIYDLNLANNIGAIGVVIHTGSSINMDKNIALQNMSNNMEYLAKYIIDNKLSCKLILETSAGSGHQIGYTLEELHQIYNNITYKYKKCIGICIDTAHIFVAGYNIRNTTIFTNFFNQFNKLFGFKNLVLIHLNDSKYELGKRHDVHQGLKHGKIFSNDMNNILVKIKELVIKNKIPIVLETHGAGTENTNLYFEEVKFMKEL